MQLSFTYEANPGRTIFAPGSLASLGDELTRLGFSRALIICTPPQRDLAERINAMLGDRSAGIFDGALMRSEEHTSELQSLMRNSYAVFCLKKKNNKINMNNNI